MAKKVTELPSVISLDGTEVLYIVQAGVAKQVTQALLIAAAGGGATDLQTAYEGGNTIGVEVAEGSVTLQSVDTTDLLTLNREFAGAGDALIVTMDAGTTGDGIGIEDNGDGTSLTINKVGTVGSALTIQDAGVTVLSVDHLGAVSALPTAGQLFLASAIGAASAVTIEASAEASDSPGNITIRSQITSFGNGTAGDILLSSEPGNNGTEGGIVLSISGPGGPTAASAGQILLETGSEVQIDAFNLDINTPFAAVSIEATQVLMENGTVALPAYAFTSVPGSGMSLVGGVLGLSVAGSVEIQITNALTTHNNNVVPAPTNSRDLGTLTTAQWRRLFIQGVTSVQAATTQWIIDATAYDNVDVPDLGGLTSGLHSLLAIEVAGFDVQRGISIRDDGTNDNFAHLGAGVLTLYEPNNGAQINGPAGLIIEAASGDVDLIGATAVTANNTRFLLDTGPTPDVHTVDTGSVVASGAERPTLLLTGQGNSSVGAPGQVIVRGGPASGTNTPGAPVTVAGSDSAGTGGAGDLNLLAGTAAGSGDAGDVFLDAGGGVAEGDISIGVSTGLNINVGKAASQIGFYAAAAVAQAADISALTLTTHSGAPDTALVDVSGSGDDGTINDNIHELGLQINNIRTILRDLGLMA